MGAQVATGGLSPTSDTTLLYQVDGVQPGKRVRPGTEGGRGRCRERRQQPGRGRPGFSTGSAVDSTRSSPTSLSQSLNQADSRASSRSKGCCHSTRARPAPAIWRNDFAFQLRPRCGAAPWIGLLLGSAEAVEVTESSLSINMGIIGLQAPAKPALKKPNARGAAGASPSPGPWLQCAPETSADSFDRKGQRGSGAEGRLGERRRVAGWVRDRGSGNRRNSCSRSEDLKNPFWSFRSNFPTSPCHLFTGKNAFGLRSFS